MADRELQKDEVFIGLNRRKLRTFTIIYGALALIGLLSFFWIAEHQIMLSPLFFQIAGVVWVIFFAIVAGTFLKRLNDPEAGIFLNATGITDRSSSIAVGQVSWKQVVTIERKSKSSKHLLIQVKGKEAILKSAKNGAVRRLMEQNVRLYNTPVVLDGGVLNCNFNELEKQVTIFFEKYGKH